MNSKELVKNRIAPVLAIGVLASTIFYYSTEIAGLNDTLNEKETVISDMGKNVTTLKQEKKELENNLIDARRENEDMSRSLTDMNDNITQLKNDKEKLQVDLSTLKTEVKTLQEAEKKQSVKEPTVTKVSAKEKQPKIEQLSTKPSEKTYTMEATAYTAYCAGCSGITRWNELDLRANPNMKVIAVDPSVIPLGSKVWVEGYGEAIAADTGGAIKGHRIDLFVPTESAAMKWGRKTVTLKIIS